METCPACHQPLISVVYEGVVISQCDTCKGHLVPLDRLESIKWAGMVSVDQLKSQVSGSFKGSSSGRLKCPRCFSLMHRQRLSIPGLDAMGDVCEECALQWLDAGELALLLLAFRSSPKYLDAVEMSRRVRQVETDPERKAAFEANLANLPVEDPTYDEKCRPSKWSIFWFIFRALLRF